MHLPPIIQDLAIILIVAGAMTLLFRTIRQPIVLGYIVAGFLVGPNFEWLPTVVDTESIKVWAEIGVIFLLFALGLEFSFRKLVQVGPPASVTALVEVAGMIGIGFLVGKAFGWTTIDSVFLGGILAISSTTIIIRAFDELEMKTRGFVRLVFGVLIVEDLVAILLMVVLTTIAVSRTFLGAEMVVAGLKLVFFLILWFVLGIFLIPTLFARVRKFLKQETLLIVSIGLCFLMVVLATKVGFSPALGAFIMGSILAETLEGEKIEHLIHPVKDLFGAIFFVSVGMLIDPKILVDYALPIFVITIATIGGKLATTAIGALLAGQSLRHSVQAGMSLAQIGEFSFIIAGLGLSLSVTSDFLYPIAISVSAITTFTTPYLIRASDPTVRWLEDNLPKRWLSKLEGFRIASATVSQTHDWKTHLKKVVTKVTTNSVVVTAIFLLVSEFLKPRLLQEGFELRLAQGLSFFIALTCSAPFLWAIAGGRFGGEAAGALWSQRRFTGPLFVLEIFRWTFAVLLSAILASRILPPSAVILAVCVLVIAILYLLPRNFEKVYLWLERRFVTNLNEKDLRHKQKAHPALVPWDSHLAELQVSSDSPLIGKKLSELTIRERFGVTITLIQRGHKAIPAPGGAEVLYPADLLQVIGSDEEIHRFRQECAPTVAEPDSHTVYGLRSIFIEPDSLFAGRTIKECQIRERSQGLVVGVEKKGTRILNPDSNLLIEDGDVIWIVGDQNLMKGL